MWRETYDREDMKIDAMLEHSQAELKVASDDIEKKLALAKESINSSDLLSFIEPADQAARHRQGRGWPRPRGQRLPGWAGLGPRTPAQPPRRRPRGVAWFSRGTPLHRSRSCCAGHNPGKGKDLDLDLVRPTHCATPA